MPTSLVVVEVGTISSLLCSRVTEISVRGPLLTMELGMHSTLSVTILLLVHLRITLELMRSALTLTHFW